MIARTCASAQLRGGTAMAAALVLLAGGGAARAQGFNGSINTATSSGYTEIAPGDIQIDAAEAVINWTAPAASAAATDVNFLSAGNTVTFHDGVSSGLADFTVLNRITPTFGGAAVAATVSFNGTVQSNLGGLQGGNVWFYSPYGIIANAGSQFNVGSLLLTTSDIQLAANGSLYLDQTSGNQIGFLQASQPGSFVRINPGAFISASNLSVNNAYVGIFAPRIEQGGVIRSDGMTALVAGEAGTITFNAGLIDVAVSVGTSDSQGIVHTGTTGGAASLDGEAKTVAMVAVSKNTALTMLLQGNIGYDPAAVGITDGAAVTLYAGSTTQADAARADASVFDNGSVTVTAPATNTTGNITLRNAQFGSRLYAFATGALTLDPVYAGINSPGFVDFVQTARLYGGTAINAAVDAAETVTAQDSLYLAPLFKRVGENVTIKVAGDLVGTLAPGQFTVTNLLSIDASGLPNTASTPAIGAAGQGGTVSIDISQGLLAAGQGLQVVADGIGTSGDQAGGNGTGGSVDVVLSNKATLRASDLTLSALGQGGGAFAAAGPATGGTGTGGVVALRDNGGTVQVNTVSLFAPGFGGEGNVTTGNAIGGRTSVLIAGQTQNWSSLAVDTSAATALPAFASSVLGSATALANGVTITASGSGALSLVTLTAENSAFVAPGSTAAHAATAGGVSITASGGGSVTVTDTLLAQARADLVADSGPGDVPVAPAMTGGQVSIFANGGTITTNTLLANASAYGLGARLTAATARGGTANVGAGGGGLLDVTGQFEVRAEAYGAIGTVQGSAIGGTARVFADNGTVNAAQPLVVSASALSGGLNLNGSLSGTGFNATGGTALIEALGAGADMNLADVRLYAKGEATVPNDIPYDGASDLPGFTAAELRGIDGNGGSGTGGTAQIRVTGGTLDAAKVTVQAYGLGGASGMSAGTTPWQSGAGIGGQALFTQSGGAVTAATLDLGANGLGGTYQAAADPGALPSLGGAASGGTARAALSGGSLTLTGGLSLVAFATGGRGMDSSDGAAGGSGGAASNGAALAELLMPAGSTATLSASSVSATASAFGGPGGASATGSAGAGGAATAGTARASLADGGFTLPGGMNLSATAFGAGTAGGTGGTAAFLLTDTLAAPATTRSIGTLQLDASGAGGTSSAGTTLFTAQAGRAASALSLFSVSALSGGTTAAAGNGFVGVLGAVPVSVAGTFFVQTPRDIALTTTAGGGLTTGGPIILNGRGIAGTGIGLLSAGGAFTATASGGGITLGATSSGAATTLTATGPIAVSSLTSTGAINASGSAITLGSATTNGTTTLAATGAIAVTNLASAGTVTANGGSVTIGSTGSLTFANSAASAGAFAATATGSLTFANVGATGAFTATSGGLATFNGIAQGSSITVTSPNIAVSAGARLGTRGLTQTILLVNSAPGAGTVLGGAGAASGWSLDAAEALRLFADQSITVQVPASAVSAGDVTIGALGFGYGAASNVGTGGTFAVTTPGRIRVIGAVAPVMSSATDRLSLTAGTFIDVVTDTGSIVLQTQAGALAGILSLTAPTVRVGTSAALTALSGITSLSEASDRLAQNDGVINVAGAVRANALVFTVSGNTLYIQNSGTDTAFANRRGFTANSLAINGLAGAQPSFAINGVINAAGTALTGLATYTAVTVNGVPAMFGGPFNPLSTINGCRVGPACGLPPGQIIQPRETIVVLFGDPLSGNPFTSNSLSGLPGASGGTGSVFNLPLVQYGTPPLLDSPPLIDEPVTGIGNDDLWQRRCDAEKDCEG
ncbi:hypothetical protein H7F51_00945 [Novosphingobium flavum]|uniref:Filamentous haemagglutinin FhaB/tRNA nuclease CdiA-like TPS domain-containing protein n=1 Tax=Novosphingobium flavum TaxID=1778672 RepID=A0A7X1KK22_9SPHN|nr:hypothetical protein [Novosphingobium flavum]MBC2664077.1 hypothetical protein [Novosphingobium flavum]